MSTNNYFKHVKDKVPSFFFFDQHDTKSRSDAWEAALAAAGGNSKNVSVYRRPLLPPGNRADVVGEPR